MVKAVPLQRAPATPLAESLRELEPRIATLDRLQLRGRLLALSHRLHAGEPPAEAGPAIEGSIALCRALYAQSRSGEALLLARASLAQARQKGDAVLVRRSATACGLLAGDSGDLVAAIEYHVESLRLAGSETDPRGIGVAWNNIGIAMGIAGHYELATKCYRRAIALLEGASGLAAYTRYCAYGNLADAQYQVGALDEGLACGLMALSEQTDAFRDQNPHGALVLERTMVRLLTALGRVKDAEPHVARCTSLAERSRTPRSQIAASITLAIHEQARGRVDLALTRLESALAHAREIPASLGDTLVCVIKAEEAAGNFERALVRMRELSDHIYRLAVDRAREHVELAALPPRSRTHLEYEQDQAEARLIARMAAPAAPPEWDALDRLAVSATLRIDPTGWHGKRVGALVKALALALGHNPLEAVETGQAAELHDIGMLSVPEGILGKQGPLNDAERQIVQRHVQAGAEMLRDDQHRRIFIAREIAAYHHARWDGEGYPERVAGKRIPAAARMCAVADSYDAMVCGVGGRKPKSMDEALAELRRQAGAQLDPHLVDSFDTMLRSEAENVGLDLATSHTMSDFNALVASLQEDRGFV